MFTENKFVNCFESISNESYYISDLKMYEPDMRIEWIYLDWNSLKKTHYRGSSCGIAYRYYRPEQNWRSHWQVISIDNNDTWIPDSPRYGYMMYKCQCYEDKHDITLD